MSSLSSTEDECSICECSFQMDTEIVITECGHTFHRSCAQERLDKKHKGDCKTCKKKMALANALKEDQTTIRTTHKDSKHDQSVRNEERKNNAAAISVPVNGKYENVRDTDKWQCKRCPMKNKKSAKKCEKCGEPQHTGSIVSYPKYPPTFSEDDDDQRLKSNDESEDYRHSHREAKATGRGRADRVVTFDKSVRSSFRSSDRSTSPIPDVYPNLDSLKTATSHQTFGSSNKSQTRYTSKLYDTDDVMPNVTTTSATRTSDTKEHPFKETVQPTLPQSETIVYISDLPVDIDDNTELENRIRQRLEKVVHVKARIIKCYSKLGVGLIGVDDEEMKDRLINDFGKIALDPQNGKSMISFVADLQLVSYIALQVTEEKKDTVLPTANEMSRRCIEFYKCEEPYICEQLNTYFPNIYKIIFNSLDELLKIIHNPKFSINGQLARIYCCANCSFFEDLPQSIIADNVQDAIEQEIQQPNILPSFIWVQVNKQMNNACILVSDKARLWSTKTHLYIDGKLLLKKNDLICALHVYPVTQSFAVHTTTNHDTSPRKRTGYENNGDNLLLEPTDERVSNKYLLRKGLRIDDHNRFHREAYSTSTNPEASEIDEETWYETEMLRNKPDIMQYIANPEHKIFQYKWNSQIWLKQFKQTTPQNYGNKSMHDQRNTPSGQIRCQLRVTVMLNTLAAVRKKSYMVGDQEVQLKIDDRMKTIVYDHRSKLEQEHKLSSTKTPFPSTHVDMFKEDCLVVYERLVNNGYNPLLLSMANARTPGGGYRKGDGAQEENIFRRSDYFRSLDAELDQWLPQRSKRFYCSSNCQYNRLPDSNKMYPMDEFGAIYTSGLTVFRQSEDTGYAYMNKPLEGISCLAMAAYRDPKLDGNMLASEYAVRTRKKIENIFAIAFHQKHDSLVVSAMGCGAFKNPPSHIAKLFRSVIEQYAGFFKLVAFAIVEDDNSGHYLNPQGNFKPFQDVLRGLVVHPFASNRPHIALGPYRILFDGVTACHVCIYEKIPCNFGAKCTDINNRKHAQEFSHPSLCPYVATNGHCDSMKDSVHMHSFIHPNQCEYSDKRSQFDDEKHAREYEHPAIRNRASPHSTSLHGKEHHDQFEPSSSTLCSFTPFHCKLYMEFTTNKNRERLPHHIQQHCLDFSHICRFGRNCSGENALHWEKSIHIARCLCPDGDKCKNLDNEDHLNSYTHSQIPDIRELCQYPDECDERHKIDHIIKFRHAAKFEQNGILRYYNLNKGINFVQNQNDNIERVSAYIRNQRWKSLPSGTIPREIINWIHHVQPVHRCNPIIFESILLHGHVMSQEYMQNLKDPTFVAHSVLQHSCIQRIKTLHDKEVAERAKEFIITLVTEHFEQEKGLPLAPVIAAAAAGRRFPPQMAHGDVPYNRKAPNIVETYLVSNLSKEDFDAIRTKTTEIANAAINLHKNPFGIGFGKDKDLGTDKTVLSILGPHLGHYNGDIFIVFKRAILHHPDANFSIQAATSFISGDAFKTRPWLDADPSLSEERVKLYHRSKLNASVPGYDQAAALELMALTSYDLKLKSMDINLEQILRRWAEVDSHMNIEAHLPPLIPLSYIDHIYIPKNLHASLSVASLRAIKANLKDRITIVSHDGDANPPSRSRGPTPPSESREEHQSFVNKELYKRYKEYLKHSPLRSLQGSAITIASTNFTDHYVLPLTMTQALDQYRFAKKHPPLDQTTYIYWQVSGGDMMLTLSNEPFESDKRQSKLRCLTCYIAPKPLLNQSSDHEHYSYLNNRPPFEHHILKKTGNVAAKSNRFYIGCNTDDFMTFCLEIQYSTGTIILTHAGPNSIYNHEKITYTFNKSELDITSLDFVHLSAGSNVVSVRNLMICFEKQVDLHPTLDKNFKKVFSASEIYSLPVKRRRDASNEHQKASALKANDNDEKKSSEIVCRPQPYRPGDDNSKLIPCHDNVNCLIQYSSHDASTHNATYSHPCRFSELCYNKERHLTHEPHPVSMCRFDKNCNKLGDPLHRAQYRHTGLPDYLVPCRDRHNCRNTASQHRIKFSHGEQVYRTEASAKKEARASLPAQYEYDNDQQPLYKLYSVVRNIADYIPGKGYFFPTSDQNEGLVRPGRAQRQHPCQYGASCYDYSPSHREKYSHEKAS